MNVHVATVEPAPSHWDGVRHLTLVPDTELLLELDALASAYDIVGYRAVAGFFGRHPAAVSAIADLYSVIESMFGVGTRATLSLLEDEELDPHVAEEQVLRIGIDYGGPPEKVTHLLEQVDDFWDSYAGLTGSVPVLLNINY